MGFIRYFMMFLIILREYSEDINSLHIGTKNSKLSMYIAEIPLEKQNQYYLVLKKKKKKNSITNPIPQIVGVSLH